ncbi:DUF4129 domain-containing protein [Sphingomonas fennica]|uniref:Protein-glutamine gamma-glutamyltransferase-like C-terminal domain-containing protein n=1 Tax=Edaphosphingomonas fennica TaxID=114404 RepID=A0A2T4I4A0_9SPHN|nr:DUF4129 domain-containing protein [Sphingomonas fennica]PTD24241.1 hypothetical protein CV103_08425 [Sphingomonas fennica]
MAASGGIGSTGISDADFAAAHEKLRADPALQFDLPTMPPPDPPPAWLVRLLKAIAPYMEYIAWGLLILAALALLYIVARHLLAHGLPFFRRRAVAEEGQEPEWRPEAGSARQLLAEADALAAAGRHAEAVHLLLVRSIEEIERRRPHLVRPALTARDIAAADALPGKARRVFAGLAGLVERSLFGGRPVDAAAWRDARAAYEDFALPGAWR